MGMSAGGGRGGVKSDINVTPLVDVVLVLLIIFMVVTPLMKKGKAVELPRSGDAGKSQPDGSHEPLYVSMTAERRLYLEQDEVSAEELPQRVAGAAAGRRVMLKGDRTLTVGDVVTAMDGIRRGRVSTVHLAVESRKDGRR